MSNKNSLSPGSKHIEQSTIETIEKLYYEKDMSIIEIVTSLGDALNISNDNISNVIENKQRELMEAINRQETPPKGKYLTTIDYDLELLEKYPGQKRRIFKLQEDRQLQTRNVNINDIIYFKRKDKKIHCIVEDIASHDTIYDALHNTDHRLINPIPEWESDDADHYQYKRSQSKKSILGPVTGLKVRRLNNEEIQQRSGHNNTNIKNNKSLIENLTPEIQNNIIIDFGKHTSITKAGKGVIDYTTIAEKYNIDVNDLITFHRNIVNETTKDVTYNTKRDERKKVLERVIHMIENHGSINYNEITQQFGWSPPEILHAIAKAIEASDMDISQSTLSKTFSKLRRDIKNYNISDSVINGLKSKIKEKFESLAQKGTNHPELLKELDDLIGQLSYETERRMPFEFDDDNSTVSYSYMGDHGQVVRAERSWDEIVNMNIDFTRMGKKSSQRKTAIQIINDPQYNLHPREWEVIKKEFDISTKQQTIPPKILARMLSQGYTDEEVNTYIKQKTHQSLTEKAKESIAINTKNKQNQINNQIYMLLDHADSEVAKFEKFLLENIKPLKMGRVKNKKRQSSYDLIAETDNHWGENTDIVTTHRWNMLSDIAHMDGKDVHMFSLGDLVECIVPGGMHLEQELRMDMLGFELMDYLIIQISQGLIRLHTTTGKRIKFYGITGNHDRATPESKADPERRFMLLIYKSIQRLCAHYPGIEFDVRTKRKDLEEEFLTVDIDNDDTLRIHYNHGDKGFNQKMLNNPFHLLGNRYHPEKDNIIMAGHWHYADQRKTRLRNSYTQQQEDKLYKRKRGPKKSDHSSIDKVREVTDTDKNITSLIVPSIAPTGSYARSRGLMTESGYMHITRNQYGLLDIHTNRLGTLPRQTDQAQKIMQDFSQGIEWTGADLMSVLQVQQ